MLVAAEHPVDDAVEQRGEIAEAPLLRPMAIARVVGGDVPEREEPVGAGVGAGKGNGGEDVIDAEFKEEK